MIGLITPGTKPTGKRSAGKPHAAFDVAGAGNVTMVAGLRSIAKAMGLPPAPTVRACSRPYLRGAGGAIPRPTHHWRPLNGFATVIGMDSLPYQSCSRTSQ
jgi:hypothetical protein